MTAKALKNLYPRLRPDERFRLAVDAVARKDWDDLGLLSGSCPIYAYRATDVAYSSRLDAAGYVALYVGNLLFRAERELAGPALGLGLLEDMRALMMTELGSDGGEDTTIEAGRNRPENAPEGKRKELDDLYRKRVAAVLGVCEGLERFCEPLGVEPAKLLAIERSCLSAWHSARRLRGKDIAADPVMAEAVHKSLQGLWSGLIDDEESGPGVW